MEADYWQQRLFKNTFTYKGQSREVNGWSVKIQLFGKRKTFSLSSSDRTQAAAEACHIYQTIKTQVWDAVEQRRGRVGFQADPARTTADSSAVGFDAEHWMRRLITRRYPEKPSQAERELSARIEHAGVSRYFPLGTNDEAKAATEAMRIHQVVVGQGWAVANQKFARELTLALRWLEDPLAWTYTTLYTWKSGDQAPPFYDRHIRPATRTVAIVESDAGIRLALAARVNSQEGFCCCAVFSGVAEALREVTRQRIDLVLANYALPDQPGSAGIEALQKARPGIVGLLYSMFEDSDQLFKSTPGGAAGYLLKRTPPQRIFDPIAETTGPLSREIIAAKIREYFQRLVAAMPAGPSALDMAKLTPREHEILSLLAKGELAKEIADTLGISIWTVHGHVKSIFEKLDVHTRTEAVVKFLQK
jgi:DNA-binding NarL/FixJ family response regulator